MREHFEDMWLAYVITAAVVALFALLIYCVILDQERWQAFATAHHCHVVERMSGDVLTTVAPIIGGNGGVAVGITSTPDKVAYLCDDGVKYWR